MFLNDLKFALRSLARAKGLSIAVVLTLALGIGANTAVFSVVNGVLFRPLAYQESNQLYLIQVVWSQMSKFYPLIPANLPGYQIWRKQCHSFEDIAIAEGASADLTGAGIQCLTAPRTPYSSLSKRLKANHKSILDVFQDESSTTPPPLLNSPNQEPRKRTHLTIDLPRPEEHMSKDVVSTPSLLEISLDSLFTDYLNEIIHEVRQSEFIGVRFWMVVSLVMGMWCFMWLTQGWACSC